MIQFSNDVHIQIPLGDHDEDTFVKSINDMVCSSLTLIPTIRGFGSFCDEMLPDVLFLAHPLVGMLFHEYFVYRYA